MQPCVNLSFSYLHLFSKKNYIYFLCRVVIVLKIGPGMKALNDNKIIKQSVLKDEICFVLA